MKTETEFNESGSKYLRRIRGSINGRIDVYGVIETFDVQCPARQHLIKKILCSGLRGKGDALQDLREARDACDRAIQLEESRQSKDETLDDNLMGNLRATLLQNFGPTGKASQELDIFVVDDPKIGPIQMMAGLMQKMRERIIEQRNRMGSP